MRRAILRGGVLGLTMLLVLALCSWSSGQAKPSESPKAKAPPRLREPVALVLADEGKWLFVANRQSGSISVIATEQRQTVAEVDVGQKLADLTLTKDGKSLLAVDEKAHELLLLSRQGSTIKTVHKVPVSPDPVSVQVSGDGARCFVASLWSRQVSVVQLSVREAKDKESAKPRIEHVIALPFAPRKQLPLKAGTQLVVADSFGGQLGVLDFKRARVESVRTLPGHNIRGLALSADGKQLLLTQQVLHQSLGTTRDAIHWGNLLTNNVRAVPLAGVENPDADLLRGSRLYHLGDVGQGGGDPAGVAVGADGTMVLALAGTGEITVGTEKDIGVARLAVGKRPTAVVLSPDGRTAYVANTFSDSVSVVDVADRKVRAEISLGPQPELSLRAEGERLFYDARLSHDGWLSCHSCHSDGHSNGLRNDNLGDNSFGAPKRVLSLRGVKDTAPWAWNGSMTSLEEQVRKSVLTTMHGRKLADQEAQALVAFLESLPPAPPLFRPGTPAATKIVGRGKDLFDKQGCATCHAPPAYTTPRTYDVGLSDEVGNTTFNPPSLRGIGQGGPFFHDNRAATLEEVFTRYKHQLKGPLTKEELDDLLHFLRSL